MCYFNLQALKSNRPGGTNRGRGDLFPSNFLHMHFNRYSNQYGKLCPLHFKSFITARGAKSIISSNCVFNPSYGLPCTAIPYTDKRTDLWSRDFIIWKINFGLWAVGLGLTME